MRDRKRFEFTSRQIVTMVVAVAVAAVLLPIGVEAATGSAVNITDPVTSSRKARVTAAGRLFTTVCDSDACAAVESGKMRVGDGSGALTVDGSVDVSGSVVSTFGLPFERDTATVTTGVPTATLADGDDPFFFFDIVSLTLANTGTDDADVRINLIEGTSPGCGTPSTVQADVTVAGVKAGDTVFLNYNHPLETDAGSGAAGTVCLQVELDAPGAGEEVTATAQWF